MNIGNWLSANKLVVELIIALLTVVVTCFYIKQVNKQRHEMVRPNILFSDLSQSTLDDKERLMLSFLFENVGRGHAFDVQFECLLSENAILKKLSLNYFKYLLSFNRFGYLFGFHFVKVEIEPIKILKCDDFVRVSSKMSYELAIRKYACVMIKVVSKDELGGAYRQKYYDKF